MTHRTILQLLVLTMTLQPALRAMEETHDLKRPNESTTQSRFSWLNPFSKMSFTTKKVLGFSIIGMFLIGGGILASSLETKSHNTNTDTDTPNDPYNNYCYNTPQPGLLACPIKVPLKVPLCNEIDLVVMGARYVTSTHLGDCVTYCIGQNSWDENSLEEPIYFACDTSKEQSKKTIEELYANNTFYYSSPHDHVILRKSNTEYREYIADGMKVKFDDHVTVYEMEEDHEVRNRMNEFLQFVQHSYCKPCDEWYFVSE